MGWVLIHISPLTEANHLPGSLPWVRAQLSGHGRNLVAWPPPPGPSPALLMICLSLEKRGDRAEHRQMAHSPRPRAGIPTPGAGEGTWSRSRDIPRGTSRTSSISWQVAFGLITLQNRTGVLLWVQANREAFAEKCFRTKSSISAHFEPHNTKHWAIISDHTAALCPKPEPKWLSDAGLASVSILTEVKWGQQHWVSSATH